MKFLKNSFRELLRYPSAVAGLAIIGILLLVSIYALATIPYSTAVNKWRGGEDVWYQNPQYAAPAWLNFFYREKQPVSFVVNSADGTMTKTVTPGKQNTTKIEMTHSFDYQADGYPQEIILYFTSKYDAKLPFVSVTWTTPDGREIPIANMGIEHKTTYRFTQDVKL